MLYIYHFTLKTSIICLSGHRLPHILPQPFFRRQRVTAKRSLGLWRLEVKQTESAYSPEISNKCVDGRSANDTPGSSDWVHIFWMFVHWTVSITQCPVQSSITREMFPKLHFLVLGKEWLDVEKEVEASRVWRVFCTVCSVECAVYSVQCRVCSVQCAVYSVQCTVCSVQCALYSMQCRVCNEQCAFYVKFLVCSVDCFVFRVKCAVFSVQCEVCSLQRAIDSVQCAVCSGCEHFERKSVTCVLVCWSEDRLVLTVLTGPHCPAGQSFPKKATR